LIFVLLAPYRKKQKKYGIIPLSLAKNGMIICVNLRGLRDNYMPAELAEIRRQDINKIQGDNSEKI
jgi:hypothetical protein